MKTKAQELLARGELSYEQMQSLASHADPQVRCLLAERLDLPPELLYFLAEDSESEVRRRIAINPTTPRQADLLLARDAVESVRRVLSEKIAKLAPNTNADELSKIQSLTYDALLVLSRDQAVRVRQILSETLKDMVDAPNEIIKHLAQDVELVVAGPVLEFSPVLSDDDLLEIISTSKTHGALNAIAKRDHVSEIVSDAVIAANEESAIADLLINDSAQIREEAIDMLADRAHDVVAWHSPLVHRPHLSENAARRMAHYLADNLLKALQERKDLPLEVIAEIKEEVKKRIDESEEKSPPDPESDPLGEITTLYQQGKLDEEYLIDQLDGSRWLHVITALALMSDLNRPMVKKIVSSQSGKGIMALSWKAGLSAQLGESLQIKLAKMPIKSMLRATTKGEYPLNEEELSWHLDLFGND